MSTKDIRNAIITRLETLFADKKEISNVFNIEDNSERVLNNGFGVIWNEGSNVTACNRAIGIERSVEIILTSSVPLRIDDDYAPTVNSLLDDTDEIIKSLPNSTLLGIPEKIRMVRFSSISEPSLSKGNTIVRISVNFSVNYKLNIN